MTDAPLVTIVTPCLNHVRFVEATMQSVLMQDYPNIEYLVVDGGSTDGSLDVVRRHANRIAWWTSEPDAGQAAAINKGLRRSRGEIVAWLNSDDLYYRPDVVSRAVAALRASPAVGMVYADGVMVDEGGLLLDWHRYRRYDLIDLLSFEVLLQPTVFLRRAVVEQAGYLDESLSLILDHALWIRAAALGPLQHVPEVWAVERTHPSAKTIALAQDFVEEARELLARLAGESSFAGAFAGHRRKIEAGFHVFAGRRYIDAGRGSDALRHFRRALALHAPSALRVWYKVVQAGGLALGAGRLFLGYRSLRRRMKHRNKKLVISGSSTRWLSSREEQHDRRPG